MMRRRDFLQATLVTVGAAAVPAGCTNDDTEALACTVEDGAAFFPQSVASGDPRSYTVTPDDGSAPFAKASVILWTRLEDPGASGDLPLSVELALDQEFTQLVATDLGTQILLTAEAAFDHCVKVKVVGLEPATTYYYRFFYANDTGCYGSRVGRTKTAPADDADVPVRFAYVSCQDYNGRYYNTYVAMATEELDFFVHLGDYVYETAGDPTFQATDETRQVLFADTDGAIALTATVDDMPVTYYAAKALGNYRDLYKTYRSDPALQAIHELFPMIATWDDHEFSDDCHGATATYFDGKQDETDVERRKAANQAWFEYMPVDYQFGTDPETGDFRYDPSIEYPQDISIYRDFTYGKHLHLVMTDLRTYRSDHLIPEEAFPGKVVATQAALNAAFPAIPDVAAPYFDVESYMGGVYKTALVAAAPTLGFDPEQVTGDISAAFVNDMIAQIDPMENPPALIDTAELATMDRGIAYYDAGKTRFYSSIGSRYLVIKDAFDVIAQLEYAKSAGASEVVMGSEQEQWFLDTMSSSDRTWKVWGNEYTLNQLAIDLTTQPSVPPGFDKRFYMNCDGWDGFRNRRSALLEQLSSVDNVVAITGDIHAFFAGTPMSNDDPKKKIVEVVGSSVSSGTFKTLLTRQVEADPGLKDAGAGALVALLDAFLTSKLTKINPNLGYAKSSLNGYCVAEVSADELIVTMNQLAEEELTTDQSADPAGVVAKLTQERFRAVAGENELYREIDGEWKMWDPATNDYV